MNPEEMREVILQMAAEITELRQDVIEIKNLLDRQINPVSHLSIAEKARLIRRAHETGDRKEIRRVGLLINGGKPSKREKSKENKLSKVLEESEKQRLSRMEKEKAKLGRTDLPLEVRKLTQKEAAAYCGVSPTTVRKWEKSGLKTVKWGKRNRYLLSDLESFIITQREK